LNMYEYIISVPMLSTKSDSRRRDRRSIISRCQSCLIKAEIM
jgi:hypothetical protein